MKCAAIVTVLMLCRFPKSSCIESNSPQTIPWTHHSSGMLQHQSGHVLLASIEEKLRTLDNIRYSASRWEMSMEELNRRMDTLDARMRRTQSALEMKLDEVSQAISSCDREQYRTRDQLSRKITTTEERLIHRTGYIESQMESVLNKLQGSVDTGLAKVESRGADLESQLMEIGSAVKAMKSASATAGEKINHTYTALVKLVQNVKSEMATHHQVDRMTNILYGIQKHVNKSASLLEQNDGPNEQSSENSHEMKTLKTEIGTEVQKIGNKVNNMYNDIWRKFLLIEELIRNDMISNNITRKEIEETQDSNGKYIEVALDTLASIFQGNIYDLNRKVETNFERVVTYQNMFLKTCHRLQDDEPKLETKVTLVLEKILDTILNRTSVVDRQMIELMEALKAHNNQVVRTVAHTTNVVTRLAEESSEQHKQLDSAMYEMGERCEVFEGSMQEFQEIIHGNVNETLTKFRQRLEEIANGEIKKKLTKEENNETSDKAANETKTNSINVIEANYNRGVVKIGKGGTPVQNGTDAFENGTQLKNNLESWRIPLLVLNKSLSLDSLDAIIHEPLTQSNDTEPSNASGGVDSSNSLEFKENSENTSQIENTNEIDSRKPEREDYSASESSANSIMLAYFMKVRKGRMTKSEFLGEADPERRYDTIASMISALKPNPYVPPDFLQDLEEWDGAASKKPGGASKPENGESSSQLHEDYNFASYEENEYPDTVP